MEQLVKLVQEKTGISEAQATTAVNTVVNFLKEKLPPGMQNQVDNYLKSGSGTGGDFSGMADKIGGMFGKK